MTRFELRLATGHPAVVQGSSPCCYHQASLHVQHKQFCASIAFRVLSTNFDFLRVLLAGEHWYLINDDAAEQAGSVLSISVSDLHDSTDCGQ